MFEQTFKNIDDILHKDAGCSSELDYTEQTSWMLFLKYLDDLEQEKSLRPSLEDKEYSFIIDPQYQWSAWAAPKDARVTSTTTMPSLVMTLWTMSMGNSFLILSPLKREPRAQTPSSTR